MKDNGGERGEKRARETEMKKLGVSPGAPQSRAPTSQVLIVSKLCPIERRLP
jgi:hypothetical protein